MSARKAPSDGSLSAGAILVKIAAAFFTGGSRCVSLWL